MTLPTSSLTSSLPPAVSSPTATVEVDLDHGVEVGEDEVVVSWWMGLSVAHQRQLLSLGQDGPLPRWAAAELWRAGVKCPLTLRQERGRVVRSSLPPRALARLLAGDRSGDVVGEELRPPS